jgi:hypothetical protein
MDDEDTSGNDMGSEASPPPAPVQKGHSRGRSVGDGGSISSRISKATERLRSASRSRKEYTMSPPFEAPYESIPMPGKHKSPTYEAPYESIPMPTKLKSPPPVSYNPDVLRSPIDTKNKHLSTGLHRSEMI